MQRDYFQQIAMEIVQALGAEAPRSDRIRSALHSLSKYCVDEAASSYPSRTLALAEQAYAEGDLTEAVNLLSGLFFQHNWEE